MKKLFQIFKRYPDSTCIDKMRYHFAKLYQSGVCSKSGSIRKVAVESIPDPVYFGLMGVLMGDILAKWGGKPELVVVRSVNAYLGFSIWSELRRSALMNWLVMRQWVSAYGALVSDFAYRSSSWSHPLQDAYDLIRSYRIWKKWCQGKANNKFDDLEIDGIICGDLVIDSYLRLKPSPFFNVEDKFVWRLLWQTLRDINRARSYFSAEKPAVYLTTYSTYIEHGIAVRVALQEKVPIFSFGNFLKFGLQLTIDHYRHTPDAREYRKTFESLHPDVRKACLDEAERILEYRMSGGIDHATGYMRNSAYARTVECSANELSELRGAVVVFLHDFYDSPHIWDDFVFTDFWDWIVTTIEILKKGGVKFFIKPHPNQIRICDTAIDCLRSKYPELKWLDVATNNKVLAQAGILCGVTVYGTIAHELAYLGIPTIGAASHVHHSFSFCRTAKNRDEYAKLLKDCHSIHMAREEMKNEALAFFVVHNSLYDKMAREVSSAFMHYWKLSASAESEEDSNLAIKALERLRNTAGYKNFISKMALYLNSNEY